MATSFVHAAFLRHITLASLSVLLIATQALGQATHQVIHHFESSVFGVSPSGALVEGRDGALYGTTAAGGEHGDGTVFRLDRVTGELTTIYSFGASPTDGASPYGRLVPAPDGSLYGTTYVGGSGNFGTVFRLQEQRFVPDSWNLSIVHSFAGGAEGSGPIGGLVRTADGSLYGTTRGSYQGAPGTVFRIASGVFTTLYAFADGRIPSTPLLQGIDGSFYGGTNAVHPLFIRNDALLGSGETLFKIDGAGTLTTIHTFGNSVGPVGALAQTADGSLHGVTYPASGTVFKLAADGTFTTLHQFDEAMPAEGYAPLSGLAIAADGSFYGTTSQGGGSGDGTIFRLDTAGTLTPLHSFSGGLEGHSPSTELVRSADGRTYGTTMGPAVGTLFALEPAGTVTTLYRFFAGNDGMKPYAGLTPAPDGFFYGTTRLGGASNRGTVYRINASGTLAVLHSFSGGADGAEPYAGLLLASDGNLYGSTAFGGLNYGTVFRVDRSSGTLTTIYKFTGGAGGSAPFGTLIQATDGNLYGTTQLGGSPIGNDSGIIFRMTLSGSFTVLHYFAGAHGRPWGPLLQATDGSLYGTTSDQHGSVFKLDPSGTFTTIHVFDGLTNGSTPFGGLTETPDGSLLGTTAYGGVASGIGNGTIFKITPAGTFAILYRFAGSLDGYGPSSTLLHGLDGAYYGTTWGGGSGNAGTVFRIDESGALTTMYAFAGGADGKSATTNALTVDADGVLYGTTVEGGHGSGGTVFTVFDNRRPRATSASLSTAQSTAATLALAGSDPDNDALTFVVVTAPTHGTLSGTAPNLTYTPAAGFFGSDRLTFKVNDGRLDSLEATVDITVNRNTVTLVTPNGGESVFVNAPYTVQWTSAGPAASFDLLLSRNAGSTWAPIVGCTSLPASTQSCVWTPSTPASSTAQIQVVMRDGSGASVTDVSNASFSIKNAAPSVTLTAPSTAVAWARQTYRTITWNHNLGPSSSMRIDYSGDDGVTWRVLAASVANTTATTGSFNWPITEAVTTTARIRVTWTAGSATAVSAAFAIEQPRILLTTVTGATTTTIGKILKIRWTHNLGPSESFGIFKSTPAGDVLIGTAPSSSATAGAFDWTVTGPVNVVTLRIRSAVTTASSGFVDIRSRIRVTSPNTSVDLAAGTTQTITWTHDFGAAQTFDVQVSLDGGSTWQSLATNVPAATATTGSYATRMPTMLSDLVRIRVNPAGNAGDGDISDTSFRLVAPTIAITNPNSTVNWTIGSTRRIAWSHNLGTAEAVNIDVTRDGGLTWVRIASGVANATARAGNYDWIVSGPSATSAQLRITWVTNASVSATSVPFRIP